MTEEVQAVEVQTPEAELEQTTATPQTETVADEVETTQQADEKKFTQAELDKIIQKRIAKAEAIAERRALKVYAEKLETMTQKAEPVRQAPTDGKPTLAQFENVEDYVEAVAEWKLEQREQSSKQSKEAVERQTVQTKVNDIYAKAEKVDGFDRDVFDSLPISDAVAWTIMDSDAPEKLMAYISQNPEEAERLSALTPARQAAEIGKLEAKLSTVTKELKVSKAPAPIDPIGNKGSSSKDPSDMRDSEFAAWRKRQIAQRR
jgi:hypothetical protein